MNIQQQLSRIADILGVDLEWRTCYGERAHQEAYVDGTATRRQLKKLLGAPKVEVDSDQKFWTYKPNGKLKALGVQKLYVEKYRNSSTFLVVNLVKPRK